MPTGTRSQSHEAILQHVLENIIGFKDDSKPVKALEQKGISKISQLTILTVQDINDLRYDPGNQMPLEELTKWDKKSIKHFINFTLFKEETDNCVYSHVDYLQWTAEMFDIFLCTYALHYENLLARRQTTTTKISSFSTSTTTPQDHELLAWDKGIQRDLTQFPTLKDPRYYDAWRRSVVALAKAQGVGDVVDLNFDVSTQGPTAIALFGKKQDFMFAVFDRCLQTNMGKTIVREHKGSFDAQRVWRDLENHHKKSTEAKISSRDLLAWLTTTTRTP